MARDTYKMFNNDGYPYLDDEGSNEMKYASYEYEYLALFDCDSDEKYYNEYVRNFDMEYHKNNEREDTFEKFHYIDKKFEKKKTKVEMRKVMKKGVDNVKDVMTSKDMDRKVKVGSEHEVRHEKVGNRCSRHDMEVVLKNENEKVGNRCSRHDMEVVLKNENESVKMTGCDMKKDDEGKRLGRFKKYGEGDKDKESDKLRDDSLINDKSCISVTQVRGDLSVMDNRMENGLISDGLPSDRDKMKVKESGGLRVDSAIDDKPCVPVTQMKSDLSVMDDMVESGLTSDGLASDMDKMSSGLMEDKERMSDDSGVFEFASEVNFGGNNELMRDDVEVKGAMRFDKSIITKVKNDKYDGYDISSGDIEVEVEGAVKFDKSAVTQVKNDTYDDPHIFVIADKMVKEKTSGGMTTGLDIRLGDDSASDNNPHIFVIHTSSDLPVIERMTRDGLISGWGKISSALRRLGREVEECTNVVKGVDRTNTSLGNLSIVDANKEMVTTKEVITARIHRDIMDGVSNPISMVVDKQGVYSDVEMTSDMEVTGDVEVTRIISDMKFDLLKDIMKIDILKGNGMCIIGKVVHEWSGDIQGDVSDFGSVVEREPRLMTQEVTQSRDRNVITNEEKKCSIKAKVKKKVHGVCNMVRSVILCSDVTFHLIHVISKPDMGRTRRFSSYVPFVERHLILVGDNSAIVGCTEIHQRVGNLGGIDARLSEFALVNITRVVVLDIAYGSSSQFKLHVIYLVDSDKFHIFGVVHLIQELNDVWVVSFFLGGPLCYVICCHYVVIWRFRASRFVCPCFFQCMALVEKEFSMGGLDHLQIRLVGLYVFFYILTVLITLLLMRLLGLFPFLLELVVAFPYNNTTTFPDVPIGPTVHRSNCVLNTLSRGGV